MIDFDKFHAYCTVDEFEASFRTLTESERDRAEVLIDDASALVFAENPYVDDRIGAVVVKNVLKRAFEPRSNYLDGSIEAEVWETGANGGTLWLYDSDKKLLHAGSARIGKSVM